MEVENEVSHMERAKELSDTWVEGVCVNVPTDDELVTHSEPGLNGLRQIFFEGHPRVSVIVTGL